jgi:hypothetical protein
MTGSGDYGNVSAAAERRTPSLAMTGHKSAEKHQVSAGHNVAEEERKNSFFLYEQSWNLVENKGSLWKTWGEAGMSMKTNGVSRLSGNVVEKTGS